jgi:hypothetical protein
MSELPWKWRARNADEVHPARCAHNRLEGNQPGNPRCSPTPGTPSALFVLKRNHPITPTLCQRKTRARWRRVNGPNILPGTVYR